MVFTPKTAGYALEFQCWWMSLEQRGYAVLKMQANTYVLYGAYPRYGTIVLPYYAEVVILIIFVKSRIANYMTLNLLTGRFDSGSQNDWSNSVQMSSATHHHPVLLHTYLCIFEACHVTKDGSKVLRPLGVYPLQYTSSDWESPRKAWFRRWKHWDQGDGLRLQSTHILLMLREAPVRHCAWNDLSSWPS